MKQEKGKKLKAFLRIKNIFFALVIVVLFAIIVITMVTRISGGTPSAFGFTLYRVSSGSMEPELKIGDVILTRECDPESLVKGDIITYKVEKGKLEGQTITHRVIRPPFTKAGKRFIQTKGDANSIVDDDVLLSEVEGKFVFKVEILNALYSFFVTPWGLLTLIALIIFAFFNEIIILIKAILGKGYEDEKKESIDDIIARYQNENKELSNTDQNSDNDIDSGG